MIIRGDCVEAMRDMPEASVDAVVCDPPYELAFMGKAWDASGVTYRADTWREAKRVLKPGGHLLAFGGTRTYHRLACAIEDAGFEIRDCLAWMYGSGFPKSLDVSKALDRAAGYARGMNPDLRNGPNTNHTSKGEQYMGRGSEICPRCTGTGFESTDPEDSTRCLDCNGTGSHQVALDCGAVTEAARQWQGWGTALKPAHEPIVLARKPLTGTVASNVTRHGTGALNVDGCRVELEANPQNGVAVPGQRESASGFGGGFRADYDPAGRWPSNVLLDETAAELLDEQSGESVSTGGQASLGAFRNGDIYGKGRDEREARDPGYGDSGGASRFFYTAKASRAERNAGLEGFAERDEFRTQGSGRIPLSRCPEHGRSQPSGSTTYACGCERVWDGREGRPDAVRNHHPTVKPIDLMRWLCRLVTPPGGHVLDPFTGSGTTGIACALEGFTFTGIEREPEYADIAEARIAYWTEHGEKALLAMYEAERRRVTAETGQMAMTL